MTISFANGALIVNMSLLCNDIDNELVNTITTDMPCRADALDELMIRLGDDGIDDINNFGVTAHMPFALIGTSDLEADFYTSAGEDYDYETLYKALGPVQFILHCCHAMHSEQGDFNFPGLLKSFPDLFDEILTAEENRCVTLIDEQYNENAYNVGWQVKVCDYLEEY